MSQASQSSQASQVSQSSQEQLQPPADVRDADANKRMAMLMMRSMMMSPPDSSSGSSSGLGSGLGSGLSSATAMTADQWQRYETWMHEQARLARTLRLKRGVSDQSTSGDVAGTERTTKRRFVSVKRKKHHI